MRSRFILFIVLFITFSVSAQSKWDKDLVVKYRAIDKDGVIQNAIVVTSDTLFYEWKDKSKPVKRKFLMNDTLATKLEAAIAKNRVLKFKCASPAKDSQNIFFSYIKNEKMKLIIFKQPIRPGSKEETFIREFLEPILVKVFEQELKSMAR